MSWSFYSDCDYDTRYDYCPSDYECEYDDDYEECGDDLEMRWAIYKDKMDRYDYVDTIKPTVLTGVAKLSELASVGIASSLWNYGESILPRFLARSEKKCAEYCREWSSFSAEINKLTSQLPIPKLVAEDLNKYVGKMERKITTWVSYHFRKVFLKEGRDSILYYLIHHIAWHPDATINCKLTAKNMLTCEWLGDVFKFRFLCTYCLKNEMEQFFILWNPETFFNQFMGNVEFSQYPLIYYWRCYFTGELSEIPATGNINIFMFQLTDVDHWIAKEYFFDFLDSDEQVQQAIWLIDTHGVLYQSVILKKLNETQRLLVYMDRAVKILLNYAKSKDDYEKFLSTWFNVRNIMTEQEFVSLFHEMLLHSDYQNDIFPGIWPIVSDDNVWPIVSDDILINVWSSASDDFKLHLFNYNDHNIFEKILYPRKYWDQSKLVLEMLSFATSSARKNLIRREFFIKHCHDLLDYNTSWNRDNLFDRCKMEKLDQLLQLCFPEIEESISFKQNLILNSESIQKRCLNYYSSGDITTAKKLLEEFLSPELIDQYKKELLISSDGILKCVIKNSLVKPEHIISTMLDFRHLITPDQFVFLFCELAKARPVNEILKTFWDSLPSDMKLNLLSYNNHEIIEKVFKSLEGIRTTEFKETIDFEFVLILLRDVTSGVRKEIAKKPFFEEYCEKLLSAEKFALVTRLINFCLTENEELAEFKRNLANNSKSFKDRCLSYFSSGDIKLLIEFRRIFSKPNPNLFFEVRENLLMSDAGMKHCIQLFNSAKSILVLHAVIDSTFHSAVLASEFKKKIIFLPSAIRKLQYLIENGYLKNIQDSLDRCLTSIEDKKALKICLFDDPTKKMQRLLDKCGEQYWKYFLMWYFEDEQLLNQFRERLPVDTIFIEMLENSIFRKCDDLPRYNFKRVKHIKFECLDRFLLWYFQTPDGVKKYKLEKMNSFQDIEMFEVLLKESDVQYFTTVTDWFFQNDREEIEKFKEKYGQAYEKICKMI